jgi:hypothetical protein
MLLVCKATSPRAGLVEAIPDTISIDALKRTDFHYTTLQDFFGRYFGTRQHTVVYRLCLNNSFSQDLWDPGAISMREIILLRAWQAMLLSHICCRLVASAA